MSETAQRYRLIASGFDARVNATSGDGWSAPSPCSEWAARDVVGHVVGNHRWLAAKVRGGDPEPMAVDADPAEAWRGAYGAVLDMTEDPAAMATMVEGPMGEMPFEQMLASFVCMDVLVHTWDLARAVGADEHLDEASVTAAYETMKPLDDQVRQPGVFGPKLEPPAGADTQTEFLYFLGRRASDRSSERRIDRRSFRAQLLVLDPCHVSGKPRRVLRPPVPAVRGPLRAAHKASHGHSL